MADIVAKMHEFANRREDVSDDEKALLRASGWKHSSDYPGSLWLWSKAFPESKTQWRWQGKEKVPHPPFVVIGATTAVALTIEAAWCDLYDDNAALTPEPPSEKENEGG